MGPAEVESFLNHLAVHRQVAASTQSQALHAIVFLYESVLSKPLGQMSGLKRVQRRQRVPVVLTRADSGSDGRPLASRRAAPHDMPWQHQRRHGDERDAGDGCEALRPGSEEVDDRRHARRPGPDEAVVPPGREVDGEYHGHVAQREHARDPEVAPRRPVAARADLVEGAPRRSSHAWPRRTRRATARALR